MNDTVRHEPRPGLYDGLLARFDLPPRERWLAIGLVRLVRIPGVIGLLLRLHRARGRKK